MVNNSLMILLNFIMADASFVHVRLFFVFDCVIIEINFVRFTKHRLNCISLIRLILLWKIVKVIIILIGIILAKVFILK